MALKKSAFQQLEFFGYIFSRDRISPCPNKAQVIKGAPQLKLPLTFDHSWPCSNIVAPLFQT